MSENAAARYWFAEKEALQADLTEMTLDRDACKCRLDLADASLDAAQKTLGKARDFAASCMDPDTFEKFDEAIGHK